LKKIDEQIVESAKFDLEDYRLQLSKLMNVVSKAPILNKIPGMSSYASASVASSECICGNLSLSLSLWSSSQRRYVEQLRAIDREMDGLKLDLKLLEAMEPEERRNPDLLLKHGVKRYACTHIRTYNMYIRIQNVHSHL
jgi:signal recognition particle GTPase